MSVPGPTALVGSANGYNEIDLSWSPPGPGNSVIAVGFNSNYTVSIINSYDGITWTDSSNNPFSGGNGNGIAYSLSQNKWVAVGNIVGIANSTDGMTWTDASNNPFYGGVGHGIAWSSSQNQWVVVGNNPSSTVCIATSPDGMTWTDASNNPFTGGFVYGIAWNGSIWVAVGTNIINSTSTVCIASSPDGMTWTDCVTAGGNDPFSGYNGLGYGIAWASSLSQWVAVGNNSGSTVCIATSTDGISWTDASNNPFSGGHANEIAWSASLSQWVAVGNNSGSTVCIATSTDGMTWTDASNNPFSGGYCYGIAWSSSASQWVAVGYNESQTVSIATSPDGMTWTDSSNNPFYQGGGNGIAEGSLVISSYKISSANPVLNYTIGSGITSLAVTSLSPGTSYTFAIQANIGGSLSSPVSFGAVSTLAIPPPTHLIGSANGYTEIDLSWSPPGKGLVAVGINSDSTVSIITSTDGMTWTAASNNPLSGIGLGIAYSPSQEKWVAVGNNSISTVCIASSPDGMTWTDSSNNPFSGGQGYGISWSASQNKWVAVGRNDAQTVCIASSPDGMTWTDSANPFAGGFGIGIAYSPSQDQWVAVGYNSGNTVCIATSPDGMTWTDSSNNPFLGGAANGIAYSSSKWVAVGHNLDSTVCIASSPDGMTWTDSENPFSGGYGTGIAWNGSQWVAVGYNSGSTVCIATSTDGMTWTDASNNPFSGGYCYGIAWSSSASQWVAVGASSDYTVCIVTSPDGMTWTPSTNNLFSGGIAYGIAGDPITITSYRLTSVSPPLSYTLTPSELTKTITGLTAGTSYTFTIQTDISGSLSAPASFGTITTATVPAPTVFVRPRVTATEMQFWWTPPPPPLVAVGYNGGSNSIAISTDGITWTPSTNNPLLYALGIAYSSSQGKWVAVGYNQGNTVSIATSPDGMTWTDASNNPFSGELGRGIAWSSERSKWVAVGNNSDRSVCIATSTDGMTWTDASNNPFAGGYGAGIAYSANQWVAVGANSDASVCIATSTDGMTWTQSSTNPFYGGSGSGIPKATAVAHNGSYWIAVGMNRDQTVSVAKSTDGMLWIDSVSAGGNSPFTGGGQGMYAIAWSSTLSYWVVGGEGSTPISKSTDGVHWVASSYNGSHVSSITFTKSGWFAFSLDAAYTSTDGMTWTPTTNPFPGGGSYGSAGGEVQLSSYKLISTSPALSYTLSPNSSSAIVSGLTPLTDYSFTIKGDVSGNYSAVIPFRTVRTSNKPKPVATVTSSQSIVNGLLNLTFTWTSPSPAGDSSDYVYYYSYGLRGSGSEETIHAGTNSYALSHTFTGLDPVRAYTFRIQRGNDAGYSEARSATSDAITTFDPRTVAGLKFWGDSADVDNGTPVSDGIAVNTWADKSGYNNDAGSTVGAVLGTDSVGHYLQFNGASSYNFAAALWPATNYFTFFVVDRPADYTGTYTLIGQSSSFSLGYDASGIAITAGNAGRIGLGNTFQSIASAYPQTPNIWCFTSYGAITAYWNKMVSGQDTAHPLLTPNSRFCIGAPSPSGVNKYSGKIREVLMYSGIMSEVDRGAVQNYLYDKWSPPPAGISLAPVPNGVVMWLDAQDTATMFRDVSGNVPATNGNYILLWKDKSGFENDINNISGVTVIYNESSNINTYPGLTITYPSENYAFQTSNTLQTGDATLFLIGQMNQLLSGTIFTHDTSGNFGLFADTSGNISWNESVTHNNNKFRINGDPYGNPFIFYGTMKKGQLLAGTYIDASGVQTGYTIDTLLISVSNGPIRLNGPQNLTYGEVIYYNRCLSEAEIQKNADYLLKKWRIYPPTEFVAPHLPGLQLWLDSSDPYTVFEDNGALSVWKDKSGRGNHASASANNPSASTYSTDGIYFDGSGQYLSLPDGALPTGSYSYYIVANFTGDSAIINAGSKDVSGTLWIQPGNNRGFADNTVAFSYDGSSWVPITVFPSGVVGKLAWNGSYVLALGTGNQSLSSIAKSYDGFTWTLASEGCYAGLAYTIVWGGGKWVSGGYNFSEQSCIRISTDGLNWTPTNTPPFGGGGGCYCTAVEYNGTYWVALGVNQNSPGIAKSTDGITWTEANNNPIGVGGSGLIWTGTVWFATGESGNATSTNGMDWTLTTEPFLPVSNTLQIPAPLHNALTTIKTLTADRYFYVAAGKGNGLMYSSDGNVWTKSLSMPTGADYSDVIYAGGLWVAVGGNIVTSTDGINWTTVTTAWLNGAPFAVAYGGGKWVVSGAFTSKLRYSTDTITWTECTNASTIFNGMSSISAVAYGNNMWVACAVLSSGNVGLAYSTDGIAWTASPTNGSAIFGVQSSSIAYGNGLWVIGCSGSAAIVYSTDGMNWTASSDGTTIMGACTAVAYGNGLWVAGGDGTNTLAYSTDGMTWTGSPSAIFDACDVVTYNGKWMAAGTGNQLAYSSDGISWTASVTIDIGTGVQGLAIRNLGTAFVAQTAFDNDTYSSIWVASGGGTNQLAYSSDGIAWTVSDSGNSVFTSACYTVSYGNGLLVAGGQGTNQLAYSSDGVTWTPSTSGNSVLTNACLTVSYGNGLWVAGSDGTNHLAYSTDGITWTESDSGNGVFTSNCRTVSYGNGLWVAGGGGTNQLAYSSDGMTWTPSSSGNSVLTSICFAVSYGNGLWVAGGYGTNQLAYSTDGMTWTGSSSGNSVFANACYAVSYGNGRWVAGSSGTSRLAYSTDGITWTSSSSGNSVFTSSCYAVSYGNGLWVAGGSGTNQLAYSTDGMTWTASSGNSVFTSQCFAAANAYITIPNHTVLTDYNPIPVTTTVTLVDQLGWVAVGRNGDYTVSIATSSDGMTWTEASNNPFSGGEGYGIAYSSLQNKWVAVGYNSSHTVCIASSADGITWTDSSNNPFSGGYGNGIAYAPLLSQWVAAGYNSGATVCIATSPDGMTWTDSSNNPFSGGSGTGIAWHGSQWVAVGFNYPEYSVSIATSTDGMTWTDASNNPFPGGVGFGIAHSSSKWVAVGRNLDNTVCIANSPDGMTWTDASNNPFSGGYCYGIAWNGSKWVAVGNNSGSTVCIAISPDGMTWTDSSTNPFSGDHSRGIAWSSSQNQWIAVGVGSGVSIATSPDGMTWTPSSNPLYFGYGIAGILTTEITKTQSSTVIIESIYDGGKSLYLGGLTGATDTSTHIQDSANNFIGRDLSGYMRGSIKEILVYNTAHDEAQRQQVEAYLKNKWYANSYVPTEMSLWLDADPAKMILVGAQSNRVQTWKDKSPYAVDVSQNIIWAQPQYGLDPITQKYGVQFGSEGLTTGFSTTPFVGATTSYSLFTVQRYAFSTDQDSDRGTGGLVCTTYATVPQPVPGFVAVGYNSDITVTIAISTDGVTWTPSNNPFSITGQAATTVAYNGSYWLVGSDGGNMAISYDGMNWTLALDNLFVGGAEYGVAWSSEGSYWLACGYNGDGTICIAKSTDGLNWIPSANAFSGGIGHGVAWSGSLWVAVGYNPSQTVCIASSSDGMTWTDSSNNPFSGGSGNGIAYSSSQNRWVAVGTNNNSGNTVCIATSPDGITWTDSSNNPFGVSGYGIAYSPSQDKWVAVGVSTNDVCIATSPDGMTWTDASNNPFSNGYGQGIAYSQNNWVAVGYNSDYTVSIATSTDGMTWTPLTNNPFSGGYGRGIASGNLAGPSLSLGTLPANFPGAGELAFNSVGNIIPGGTNNYKPMLTDYVVNSQIYNTFYNGTPVDINQSTGVPIASVALRIGFSGDLTPAFKGAMRGYIYEMLVYNRPMGTEERQAIEGYLAWKWGVQGDLPGDHPYYMMPPPSDIPVTPQPPPTPFTPILIYGSVVWLDGADPTTLILDNTSVTQWNDKSDAGNNATGYYGPVYSNNTVLFNSGYFTTNYTANPTAETVFIVMSFNVGLQVFSIIHGTFAESRLLGFNGANMFISSKSSDNNLTIGSTFLYDYTLDTTFSMYYNGAFDVSGETDIFIAGTTIIGADNNYYNRLSGSISEIVIYNRVLTTLERQKVEGYLAWKWSIQAQLPAEHPYKSAAP